MREIGTLLRELKRYGNSGRDCALAAEDALAIAAALEAAREDAAEARQNGYELGLLAGAQEADRLRGVIARYERKLDAAIDQARGKAGGGWGE